MGADEADGWYYYAADGAEALRVIEESLLQLESDERDPANVHRLYRALHTLKGNSAVMGLPCIEHLSHAAEDMVGLVRDGGVAVERPFIDLMLRVVDVLGASVERAGQEHRDAEESALHGITAEIRAWNAAHSVGRVVEAAGAVRGDILIFTESPADGAATGDAGPSAGSLRADPGTLEVVLSFVEDVLPTLRGELAKLCGELDAGAVAAMDPAQRQTSLPGGRLASAVDHLIAVLAESGLDGARAALEVVRPGLFPSNSAGAREAAARGLVSTLVGIEDDYAHSGASTRSFGVRASIAEYAPSLLPPPPALDASEFLIPASVAPEALIASEPPPAAAPAASEAGAAEKKPISEPRPRSGPAAKGGAQANATRGEVLRIEARKVSTVMDLAGEIGLACGAVVHHPELKGREMVGFAAAAHKLEMLIRELQNEVSSMRLVPVEGVFQRMQRVVRDTAQRTGKKVELVLSGEETEIDKVLVDALHDPLVHVLRNAIDHGLELPEERLAAGKRETGRIQLSAQHQGGEVAISIRDDGKGLSSTNILKKAKERGLCPPDASPSLEEIFRFVFLPGFSTKQSIDELSGRGVGMDVIKTTIESFRGRVELASVEGRGTTVSLVLPLTLAFVEAMIVREGPHLFALPIERVIEVLKVDAKKEQVQVADGHVLLRLRDKMVPVLWLSDFYAAATARSDLVERVVVVVQTSRGSLALPVDALFGTQQVVLKPLTGLLASVRAAAGCGMLRTGDVALTLDCERLFA